MIYNVYDKDMKFVSKSDWTDVNILKLCKSDNLRTGKFKSDREVYYVFVDILPDIKLELLPKNISLSLDK